MRQGTWVAAALLALSGSGLAAQAELVLVDSLVLEQNARAFLTVPIAIVPDGDGYLVTDAQQPHDFRFGPSGALDRLYGREGEGPGEFKEVARALRFDDTRILAVSWSPPAAQLFERATGRFAERIPLQGAVEEAVLADGSLWISGVSYENRTALRRVPLQSPESAVPMASIPASYRAGDPLHGMFPGIPFVKWADTLLVGFEPLAELLLLRTDGTELGRFSLPAARRRGTPPDPAAVVLEQLRGGRYQQVFGTLSALRGLYRRSDGSFLLVHFDHEAGEPPVRSVAYVSVMDASRRLACLDAGIPLGPDAQPTVGVDGDHLLVLEQVVSGLDVIAVLRRYRVDSATCRWTPIQ